MKQFLVGVLTLLFVLGFTFGTANAEDNVYLTNGQVLHGKVLETLPNGSVKIKKNDGKTVTYKKSHVKKITHTDSTEPKKEEKKVEKKSEHKKSKHHDEAFAPMGSGVNNNGRLGYFFSDTSATPNKGQWMGAAGAQFYSVGSQFIIPAGVAYGLTKDLQVSANTGFYTGSGISGLTTITAGGKYHFNSKMSNLNFAAGLDLSLGPLNNTPFSSFGLDPYGVATYAFADGLELNGQFGVFIPVTGYKVGPFTVTPPAYVQINGGASKTIAENLTGIAEIDINGLGSGSTPMIVGVRTGKDVQLQGFGGLDLGPTVGLVLGGSVALVQ